MNLELTAPMPFLPDGIWFLILDLGTKTSRLDQRDLCSVAMTCRRLNLLSSHPAPWSNLLSLHFLQDNPSISSKSPSKLLYRTTFEMDKAQNLLRLRGPVDLAKCRVSNLRARLKSERETFRVSVAELIDLERARSMSVALNVWQPPEVISGRERLIVNEMTGAANSHIAALTREVEVCENRINVYEMALSAEECRLSEVKEELAKFEYHPLKRKSTTVDNRNTRMKAWKSWIAFM